MRRGRGRADICSDMQTRVGEVLNLKVVSRWLSGAPQHQADMLLNAGRTRRPRPWDVNLLELRFQKGQPASIGDRIWRRRALPG